MRKELCTALVQLSSDTNMVFLTGDLGFMALEPLQTAMGQRFINAGVAEQNMISVAAAFARDQWNVWCYSIASFCVMRPLEMIRNDICLHHLPVKLIGKGVMGPTHHAVDDYGILLTLPRMHVYIPAFDEDVPDVIATANQHTGPAYIRLGRGELPNGESAPAYAPWRQLLHGDNGLIVTTGPIAGMVWQSCRSLPPAHGPDVWLVSELPLHAHPIPDALWQRATRGQAVVVVEEHVSHGGLAHMLAYAAAIRGMLIPNFHALHAPGLDIGVYGSQAFLRGQSSLTAAEILQHFGIST